jgi:putative nucleotidyltransferase with HDIG domain
MTALYRVRQFLLAVVAWRGLGHAEGEVMDCLPPDAARLFRHMPSYDRRHALRVAQMLRERGHGEPELLAAALLHDVGKTAQDEGRLRLWHRVAVVLLRLWPGLLRQVAEDRPGSWRYPFYVQQQHAAIGAERASRAGCSPRTVQLVRRHEDGPCEAGDAWLAALQAADDEN